MRVTRVQKIGPWTLPWELFLEKNATKDVCEEYNAFCGKLLQDLGSDEVCDQEIYAWVVGKLGSLFQRA